MKVLDITNILTPATSFACKKRIVETINDIVGNYIENIKILENNNNLIKTYLDNDFKLQLSDF